MYQKQLHLLELLLESTQSGRAVWRQEDPDTHRTSLSGFSSCMRFKRLGLAGQPAAAPDVVEVSVGAETLTFYSGSEGYDLAVQILEAAYPEVFQHAHLTAIRLDAMINRIESTAT